MNAGFDRYADTYEDEVERSISFIGQSHAFFTEAKVNRLLQLVRLHLGDPADVRALDVGCGVGETDTSLARHVRELHGVDVAAAAIERAAAANASVPYRTYDGRHLPFDDATFDLVFAICVLHHVVPQQRVAFTAELARVARPTGLVAVIEHNPGNPLTRLAVARCSFDADAVLLRRRESVALLEAAGMTVVESRYFLFFPWRIPGATTVEESALGRLPLGAQYLAAARASPAR
jgi:SAM-dependent methyltransferase